MYARTSERACGAKGEKGLSWYPYTRAHARARAPVYGEPRHKVGAFLGCDEQPPLATRQLADHVADRLLVQIGSRRGRGRSRRHEDRHWLPARIEARSVNAMRGVECLAPFRGAVGQSSSPVVMRPTRHSSSTPALPSRGARRSATPRSVSNDGKDRKIISVPIFCGPPAAIAATISDTVAFASGTMPSFTVALEK